MPIPEEYRISDEIIALLQLSNCETYYENRCWWVRKHLPRGGRTDVRVEFSYRTLSFEYESFVKAIQRALEI